LTDDADGATDQVAPDPDEFDMADLELDS